jgi:hypothetical protein
MPPTTSVIMRISYESEPFSQKMTMKFRGLHGLDTRCTLAIRMAGAMFTPTRTSARGDGGQMLDGPAAGASYNRNEYWSFTINWSVRKMNLSSGWPNVRSRFWLNVTKRSPCGW